MTEPTRYTQKQLSDAADYELRDDPNELEMDPQRRTRGLMLRQAAADAREVVDLRMKVLEHAAMATFIRGGDTPRTIEAARLVLCQRLETAEAERDRLAQELEALREEMKGWQSGAATEAARGDRLARVVAGMRELERFACDCLNAEPSDPAGRPADGDTTIYRLRQVVLAEDIDRLTATGGADLTPTQRTQARAREEVERLLRLEWVGNHGCPHPGTAYMDDGEMQCCGHDFRREPIETLRVFVFESRMEAMRERGALAGRLFERTPHPIDEGEEPTR